MIDRHSLQSAREPSDNVAGKFLLLQVRDRDDPMRENEIAAFARALGCTMAEICVLDVLTQPITPQALEGVRLLLIGGSGDYSVCGSDDWLLRTLEGLRLIYQRRTPLFASCWGFQALARALGGKVANDRSRAEVGTHPINLTEAGQQDALFRHLPNPFLAPMGHEDHVIELPPGAIRLASSPRVINQAYTFADRPIYATQFHPELRTRDLAARVRQYPEYLALVTGQTLEAFEGQLRETPDCQQLIGRFLCQLGDSQWM